MKKVVVFLADGFEEVEGLTVVDLLRRAGAVVETVSVMGNCRLTEHMEYRWKRMNCLRKHFLMTQNFLYFREVCREHCI